jgi:hypothetical protein
LRRLIIPKEERRSLNIKCSGVAPIGWRVDACLGIYLRFGVDDLVSLDDCKNGRYAPLSRGPGALTRGICEQRNRTGCSFDAGANKKSYGGLQHPKAPATIWDVQTYSSDPPLCRLIAKLMCHWEPIPSRYGAFSSVVQHTTLCRFPNLRLFQNHD